MKKLNVLVTFIFVLLIDFLMFQKVTAYETDSHCCILHGPNGACASNDQPCLIDEGTVGWCRPHPRSKVCVCYDPLTRLPADESGLYPKRSPTPSPGGSFSNPD